MATSTTTSTTSDGPVLTVIAKRLRNLRKKLNRITQIEDSLALGKPLNREQLDVLNSKPSVLSRIDELDKLRPLISSALDDELSLALQHNSCPKPEIISNSSSSNSNGNDDLIREFARLMYFGTMFDVKPQSELMTWTKMHERGCCLSYNCDDMLGEGDLDLISSLQRLIVSTPGDSCLSHEKAIELCLKHFKLWIDKADQPIDSNSNVTYAVLREKLNKIMSSDYFTATPQMQAAVGNFAMFQVPTQESMVNVEVPIQVEASSEQYQETVENAANHEEYEHEHEIIEQKSGNEHEPGNIKESHKDEWEPENSSEVQIDKEQSQNVEVERNRKVDLKDQPVHRRSQRGGRGGGWRGNPNGRGGGRGSGRGNGPHQNGRNQYNDNYYPRNNNYNRLGRGGASGGGGYYNSSGAQGNHSQDNSRVEA